MPAYNQFKLRPLCITTLHALGQIDVSSAPSGREEGAGQGGGGGAGMGGSCVSSTFDPMAFLSCPIQPDELIGDRDSVVPEGPSISPSPAAL